VRDFGLQRLREVNWRIALPIIIALGAVIYLVYYAVTASPGREIQQTLSVTLQRFGKCLLKRDTDKLLRYCSRPAVKQCADLLAEIAARERRDPTFRFARFAILPIQGGPTTQSTSIDLRDEWGQAFLILECRVVRFPDNSWRIVEVKWHSAMQL